MPPLRATPLVASWGAESPGTPHAERRHDYHLRHQVTHVRFDWTRHAVVGTTRITVAPLAGASAPLSAVALDAVGMRIRCPGLHLRRHGERDRHFATFMEQIFTEADRGPEEGVLDRREATSTATSPAPTWSGRSSALEARRRVEAEGRVIGAIDRALARLGAPGGRRAWARP